MLGRNFYSLCRCTNRQQQDTVKTYKITYYYIKTTFDLLLEGNILCSLNYRPIGFALYFIKTPNVKFYKTNLNLINSLMKYL